MLCAHMRKLIDFPVDMQCSDLTRTCYASYDADAYCCEQECEVYPWREEAQSAGITAETVDAGEKTPRTTKTMQSTAQGMVHSFLEAFLENYPYVPNHRHKFQLALGREARRYGMNEEELNQLIDLAVSNLSMPDSDGPEIKANILDAYYFAEEKKLETNRRKGFKGSWGHRVPSTAYPDDETDPMEAEDANREIRLSAPYLPDWIFESLPEMFRQGLEVVKDFRQRDMLLLGMMTNLSGCLPNVRMVYDDADVFPHLFLSVIASAASGKGILAHAAKLAREIQKMLEAENEARMREFEEAQILWEQERSRAAKEQRKPDMKLKPEPVKQRTLILTAMRKYEAKWDFYELKCTDEDFRIALAIMEVLLQHSLTLSTSLRTDQASPGEMHQYFRVRAALEKLNPEFRYHDLMDSLRSEGMSDATAKRVRKRLLKMELIVQEGNVYRFSSRKWRARMEKGKGDWGTR